MPNTITMKQTFNTTFMTEPFNLDDIQIFRTNYETLLRITTTPCILYRIP